MPSDSARLYEPTGRLYSDPPPQPPTTAKEARERLEALAEDIYEMRKSTSQSSVRRQLQEIEQELRSCLQYFGPTKKPVEGKHTKNRDGQRQCAADKAWLPISEFDYKDRARGLLRSHCREHWRAYQRERYVAANKKALIVELREGDGALEARCAACGELFAVGDRIVGVSMVHLNCGGNVSPK